MKSMLLPGALGLALLVATPAAAFEAGEWVLARFEGGPKYFPGIVTSHQGGTVKVQWDDGTGVSPVPASHVKTYNWRVGYSVECEYRPGEWYAARITALDEGAVTVLYEDGVKQSTNTGKCRSS